MKIGVIGGGVVGHATARTYMEYGDVRVSDRVKEKSTHSFIQTVQDADIVFICLPERELDEFFTLMIGAGDYDSKSINWVLKSTVEIGRTLELSKTYSLPNIVHSPEFLTARCAVADAQVPSRNIIGIPDEKAAHHFTMYDGMIGYTLHKLYRERFPHVPTYLMSSDESEATKLIQNAFFAVKVSFFNEVEALCAKQGLDWSTVLNALLADGRISPSHTKVPGPDGRYGFGGACLPKDLNILRRLLNETGVRSDICTAALERNEIDRSADR